MDADIGFDRGDLSEEHQRIFDLWGGVFNITYLDLWGIGPMHNGCVKQRKRDREIHKKEAHHWFFKSEEVDINSFLGICSFMGWDINYCRKFVNTVYPSDEAVRFLSSIAFKNITKNNRWKLAG